MNLKILKNKDFSLLLFGKAVSITGSNMQQFALSLYVLAVTGSATVFASIIAISILPRLLLSPVAGVFGDWFDRKKSIVTLDFINGFLIAVFGLYYSLNGSLSIINIYILVILLEVTEIFFGSAMSAVLPSIVHKEDLFQANSIRSVVSSLCSMLSPLLAAVLYGALGLKIIFFINAISFILSAISELFIHIPATHKQPEKINLQAFKTDLIEGIKIINNNKMIMNIIGLGVILNFCLSPLFSVGLIFIVRETLNGSELQYGIFSSAIFLSMFLAPLTLGGIAQKVKVGKLTVWAFAWVAVLIGLLAFVPTNFFLSLFATNIIPFIILTAITFSIGMVVTLANVAVNTLFGTIVPKSFMGRTGTVMNLGLSIAIPIGQMLFGVAFDIAPASLAIVATSIIMFIAVLYYKKALLGADSVSIDSYLPEKIVTE